MIDTPLIITSIFSSALKIAESLLTEMAKNKIEKLEKKSNKKNKEDIKKRIRELVLFEEESKIILNDDVAPNLLKNHIKNIEKWSDEISFSDLKKAKKLSNTYIELKTFIMPQRLHMSNKEKNQIIPLVSTITKEKNNFIILGTPGAGKTTSMKKFCTILLKRIEKGKSQWNFPILIRFRALEYDKKTPLRDKICEIIPFELSLEKTQEIDKNSLKNLNTDVFISFLEELKIVIILDGFDEIPTSEGKQNVIKEIRDFSSTFKKSKIILTCRTGEFNYNLSNTKTFEIAPLQKQQIIDFSNKWLGKNAHGFLIAVKGSPYYDTALRPLTLAHLCAIYERIGNIPEQPKIIYKKVVSLLLTEWDEQRSIIRKSEYSKFSIDRKFEFLSYLAYHLTINKIRGEFTEKHLQEAYLYVAGNFGLPRSKRESKIVSDEIESHTGLFIKSSYDSFEFVHKSIQEYLTAEYLVKLPTLRYLGDEVDSFGSELAIATSISSNPSLYFSDIILGVFQEQRTHLTKSFYNAFISRILVEKPDFYPSEDIVLAVLIILNHRVTSNGAHDDFFLFISKVIKEEDFKIISKYYSMDYERSTLTSVFLLRKKRHKIYKLKSQVEIFAMFEEIKSVYRASK